MHLTSNNYLSFSLDCNRCAGLWITHSWQKKNSNNFDSQINHKNLERRTIEVWVIYIQQTFTAETKFLFKKKTGQPLSQK